MSTDQDQQQPVDVAQLYNDGWAVHLANGNEDFGDVEQALEFLHATGAMEQGHDILEIGCGIGKLADALFHRGFTNLTCTDVSAVSIGYGNEKYPHLDLRVMDATDLDFDAASFDSCMSFDLVEHIHDVDKHLSEVYRVLKPNGAYLFQTPNIITNSIYETIKSRGFGWRPYHPSLQTAAGLQKRLRRAGFSAVRFVKMAPTSQYKIAQLPSALGFLLTVIPWNLLPMAAQIGFWVEARK